MIPSASSQLVISAPWSPQSTDGPLVSKCMGGSTIGSADSLDYIWVASCNSSGEVTVNRSDLSDPHVLFTVPGISHISFAFDQNMSPVCCYVSASGTSIYRFDPVSGSYIHQFIGTGIVDPRVLLDYPIKEASQISDVVLCYVKGTSLMSRIQRENYLVERTIETNFGGNLSQFYLMTGWRLMWESDLY